MFVESQFVKIKMNGNILPFISRNFKRTQQKDNKLRLHAGMFTLTNDVTFTGDHFDAPFTRQIILVQTKTTNDIVQYFYSV